jgi:aryl-alcohol dehydrogenase-like predicted oxidoreductase
MKRRKLGALEVSALGLGCATTTPFYGEPNPASAIDTIRRARELGSDFLDTSDAYGNGRNEELIGRAVGGRRHDYVIASKFGNLRRPDGTPTADGRPEYVKTACERTLQRLQTEVIDLYYIHRVDPAVQIEDTVGAMSELVRVGKVRFLGISEAGAQTIRRAHATHPMSAMQIEYSLWTRDVEVEILGPLQRARHRLCRLQPARPRLFDRHRDPARGAAARGCAAAHAAFPAGQSAAQPGPRRSIGLLAEAERCTPAQLALAWVLSRGPSIVPIAGTSHRRWLEENAAATEIRPSAATAEALERLFRPGAAAGAR